MNMSQLRFLTIRFVG
ncbi:hypothetical protein MTR67_031179 [Solanum verrucosum]|uniref:Uncharacterized protein n=1 Tax=Solanum verrucosum TaxID=315347 RepID=A0AAF0U251_SOLVR|nr:hypothetical protein MTR67_031179 [Solanum verrucosum]